MRWAHFCLSDMVVYSTNPQYNSIKICHSLCQTTISFIDCKRQNIHETNSRFPGLKEIICCCMSHALWPHIDGIEPVDQLSSAGLPDASAAFFSFCFSLRFLFLNAFLLISPLFHRQGQLVSFRGKLQHKNRVNAN